MRVIAIAEFLGVPDGAVYGRIICAGEELTGDLAQVALRDGLAALDAEADEKPPEPKSKRAR